MRKIRYLWFGLAFSAIFVSVMCLWPFSTSQKLAAQTPSINVQPVAAMVIPNLSTTLKNYLSMLEPFIARELQKEYQREILPILQKFLPAMRNISLHQLLQLAPDALPLFGINPKKMMSLMLWIHQDRLVPVLTMSVDQQQFMNVLQLAGFAPHIERSGNIAYLFVGHTKPTSLVGVFLGDNLHLAVRNLIPNMELQNDGELRQIFNAIAKLNDPLQAIFAQAGQRTLWQDIKQEQYHIALSMPDINRLKAFSDMRTFGRYLKGGTIAYKLSPSSYNDTTSLQFSELVKPFLDVLRPIAASENWADRIPHFAGWLGQIHINLPAILQLQNTVPSILQLPPDAIQEWHSNWKMAEQQLNNYGFSLQQIAKEFSGQYVSGFLWPTGIQQHISLWLQGEGFKGHLRGVFALFGLNQLADVDPLFQRLLQLPNRIKGLHPALAQQIQLREQTISGFKSLEIQLTDLAPFYLVAHGKLLLFAGDKATLDQFLAVWSGKQPSLAQQMQSDPSLASQFPYKVGQTFALHPRVLSELISVVTSNNIIQFLPQDVRLIVDTFASILPKIQLVTAQTNVDGLSLNMNSNIIMITAPPKHPIKTNFVASSEFLQLPTTRSQTSLLPVAASISLVGTIFSFPSISATIAAIAIPAFLKFTRQSKTSEAPINIKAIGDGAIAWFDAEHANTEGDPLPKHFPNGLSPNGVASGTYVMPAQKPCANGNPQYPRNSQQWDQEPWRSLKFGINRPHYFQYVYITSGTGTNAQFTIRAHADMDCDGKLSTYEVRGMVNPNTGEVERTNLIITDALE